MGAVYTVGNVPEERTLAEEQIAALRERGLLDALVCPRTGIAVEEPVFELGHWLSYIPSPLHPYKDAAFDWLASWIVDDPDIVVGWTGMSRALFARSEAYKVLVAGSVHIRQHRKLLDPTYRRYGVQNPVSPYSIRRMEAEYNMADRIVVISEFAKRTFLVEGVPEEKLIVAPVGVNLDRFHPDSQHETGTFTVTCSSTIIDLQRGIHHLLQAWEELDLTDAELVVTGRRKGFPRDLYEHYREDPSIWFPGWVDDIESLYAWTDVYAFTGLQDGFPKGPLEAMACGIPVIVSDQMGVQMAVEDEESGFVVEAGAVDQIKQRIRWLYEHPEERSRMGAEARSAAEAYTVEAHKEKFLQAIPQEGVNDDRG